MGKIKSKLIKRTAKEIVKRGIQFHKTFQENKKIIGNTMPSKKIRNQIAGFLARQEKNKED